MIEREKERYGWEFLFLGANMDAVQEAARFGISSDRAVRFENDAQGVEPIEKDGEITGYRAEIMLDKATYEEWFDGSFTKTICGAKNRNQLLKAKTIAEELGLVENKDFFLIRDACHTELEPEEFDENGGGMTLTCIGFRPLPDEIAHQISHKFHLY